MNTQLKSFEGMRAGAVSIIKFSYFAFTALSCAE